MQFEDFLVRSGPAELSEIFIRLSFLPLENQVPRFRGSNEGQK